MVAQSEKMFFLYLFSILILTLFSMMFAKSGEIW